MILVTIKIDVRSAKQKELAQTLSALAGRVRKEAGCVSSAFYREVENENALCVIEEWATQPDLDARLGSQLSGAAGGGEASERPGGDAVSFRLADAWRRGGRSGP